MKRIAAFTFLLAASAAGCFGQKWEFGGVGGASFLNNVNVTAPAGSAKAGFQPGAVLGAFLGQNLYSHFSGEIRYLYMQSNQRIQSGGTEATFSGNAHLVHYDLVWHTSAEGKRATAFVALGGGMKLFRGTGKEAAYQPNYQYGYMTKTQQIKPMASVGGGVKFKLTPHLYLRAEVRGYITPFPQNIIAAAPGAKFGKILNDIVPTVAVSYEK